MFLVKSISFVFIYLLTSYDENGDKVIDDNEKIPYDEIGNPLTYRVATISWPIREPYPDFSGWYLVFFVKCVSCTF